MTIPIKYQLDTLGGDQFEDLIQSLLVASLGLGVEAWGGSADHGKDAYCTSELNFPNRQVRSTGPFIFQAKFVSGANAAGARFENRLLSAVSHEAELIKRRIHLKKWTMPQHYALFTNAPVTARQRSKIAAILGKYLPKTTVTVHGATGVSSLLDGHISVSRSFPQLLGLRNLTELLSEVVRQAAIQRSEAAIKEAESLAQVFVPTSAYSQAWQVLAKHNFVVLEGPPEMGKTAIAWMIAAVQLTQRWEAIDCDHPDDFFGAYRADESQVFVADDAFGTTEYDPTRGDAWGRHLHKVLPKLNTKHWLIWTSRMHILNKALQEMTPQGTAAKFPKPAEVIVNASRIESRERALILFRHARAAGLQEAAKQIVRQNAAWVIANDHFTPERIKRFVAESLPELVTDLSLKRVSSDSITSHVIRAIENPTERMQKAFAKLDPEQKWLLIALLDSDRSCTVTELESTVRRFTTVHEPVNEQVRFLEEGFLHRKTESNASRIEWIHPSYRDLVISELSRDETLGTDFLRRCSINGVRLALSVAGGASGDRRFPMMSTNGSWEILEQRILQIIAESRAWEIAFILMNLRSPISSASDIPTARNKLLNLLNAACIRAKSRLDELDEAVSAFVLQEFYDATMELQPPPPMPNLHKTLIHAERVLDGPGSESGAMDASDFEDWATIISIVAKTDQRLLIQSGFPRRHIQKIKGIRTSLIERIEGVTFSDSTALAGEISYMKTMSTALLSLRGIIRDIDNRLFKTARRAQQCSESLAHKYGDFNDPDDWQDDVVKHNQAFDLERMFADL